MNTKGMKVIGKGSFSTVYKKDAKTVFIMSRDNVKECMALGWFPKSRLFPKIERVGYSDDGESAFYEERYYPKVRSLRAALKKEDYELYKVLRSLDDVDNGISSYGVKKDDLSAFWIEEFKRIPKKFKTARKALIDAVQALENYGQNVCFEISPRNVAVHNGRLVLLDCFFFTRI